MIMLLEAVNNMMIRQLIIKRLYGVYNYDVSFNDDLTFIYGDNGCGKTTILDILSSILTGRIYKLLVYNFEEIKLIFHANTDSPNNEIKIISSNGNLRIHYNDSEVQEIFHGANERSLIYSRDDSESYDLHRSINMSKFVRYIKNTFNYIYLPLSRNSLDGFDESELTPVRIRREIARSEKDTTSKNYLNDSIRYVEEIIRTGCLRISSKENEINTRFRSSIFTSSLIASDELNFRTLLTAAQENNSTSSISHNKKEYIKTLKAIGEWNEEASNRVNAFFDNYKKAYEESKRSAPEEHFNTVDFLLMNMEFQRIKSIADAAQKIEAEKEKVQAPITSFLSTVNAFLNIGEDRKKININNEGKLIVSTDRMKREISLYNLSSGEKQIIIIFACLIFGMPVNQSGIYIIDEPEASLHLTWQKRFVESIKNANSSIQLIFATHSPEIIGKYTNKAVKLVKTVDLSKTKKEDESYE